MICGRLSAARGAGFKEDLENQNILPGIALLTSTFPSRRVNIGVGGMDRVCFQSAVIRNNQGSKMRFLLAVMAVTVALSLSGASQKTRPYNPKSSGADAKGSGPKSTAPPPKAGTSASSGKELQRVENQSVKGGHSGQAKKTRVASATSDRSSSNPPINFNGRGGGTTGGGRTPGSLKGRLKQKGQGKQH
jgi:hypothetical protein